MAIEMASKKYQDQVQMAVSGGNNIYLHPVLEGTNIVITTEGVSDEWKNKRFVVSQEEAKDVLMKVMMSQTNAAKKAAK